MDADQTQNKSYIPETAKKKRQILLLEKLQKNIPITQSDLKEIKKLFGSAKEPGVVNTHEQVAKVFGVDVRTVRRWGQEGMPNRKDGSYSITDIQEWRFFRRNRKKVKGIESKTDWDIELKKIKTKLAQAEYKERMSRLVPIRDVEIDIIREFSMVKQKLLMLPRKVAPLVVGLEIKEIEIVVRKIIEEIINDFTCGKFETTEKERKRKSLKKPKKKK